VSKRAIASKLGGMTGGSKLYVYEWVEEKLVGRSFFDAHLYITTLKTLKFFIIFGDVHHSLHLLRWREDIRMLQVRPHTLLVSGALSY
jgi:hypothetical protein